MSQEGRKRRGEAGIQQTAEEEEEEEESSEDKQGANAANCPAEAERHRSSPLQRPKHCKVDNQPETHAEHTHTQHMSSHRDQRTCVRVSVCVWVCVSVA